MRTHHVSFQGDPSIILTAMRLGGKQLYSWPQALLMAIASMASVLLTVLGGAGLFIAVRVAMGLHPLPDNPILPALAGLAAGAFLLWLQNWSYRIIALRAANGALGRDVSVELTSEGMRLIGGQSVWFTAWEDVDAIAEAKTCLGLVIGGLVIHLPYSAFDTVAARDAALADIARWHRMARVT